MNIILTPTDHIIELKKGDEPPVKARAWEGYTDDGTKVHALISLIAVSDDYAPHVHEKFAERLQELVPASKETIAAFPLRMII